MMSLLQQYTGIFAYTKKEAITTLWKIDRQSLENSEVKLLWDFTIQTERKIGHNKPDIVVVDKKKLCIVNDMAYSFATRGNRKEKVERYTDKTYEILKCCMFLQLKMYCNQNYYGSTCKTYCIPTNSEKGHYKCDKNTGRKKCYTGWTGENCHVNQDDCMNNRCHSSATCIDGVAYYTCLCPPERTGTTCDILLHKTTARLIQTASTYQTKSTSVSHDEDSQKSVSHVTIATTTSRHLYEASTIMSDTTLKVKLNVTAAKTSRSPPVTKQFHTDATSETTIPSKATSSSLPIFSVQKYETTGSTLIRSSISEHDTDTNITTSTASPASLRREAFDTSRTVIAVSDDSTDKNASSTQPAVTPSFLFETDMTKKKKGITTKLHSTMDLVTSEVMETEKSLMPTQFRKATTEEHLKSDSTLAVTFQPDLGDTTDDFTEIKEKSSFDSFAADISRATITEANITSTTQLTDTRLPGYYVSEDVTELTEISRTNISTTRVLDETITVRENETDFNMSSVQPTTSLFLTTNITEEEYSTHIPENTTISFTPIKDSTDSVTSETTSFGINETEIENITVLFDYKISASDHLTTNISSVAPVKSDITSSTLFIDAKVSDYYVSEDITTLTEINRTNISSQTSEVTMSHSSPRQPTDHFLFTDDFIDQFNATTEKGPSKSENITDFSRENATDKLNQTIEKSTTLHTSTISKDDEMFYNDTKTVEAISLPSESSHDTSSVPAIPQIYTADEIVFKTFASVEEGKAIYPTTEPTSIRIETSDSWVENVTIQTAKESSTDDFTKLLETQSVSSVRNYTGYSATDYNTSKMSTEEAKALRTEVLFTTESTNISTQSSSEVSRFVPYLDNITAAFQRKTDEETVTSNVTIVGEKETDINVSSVQPTTSLFLATNITEEEYSTHIPANTTISITPVKDSTDSVTTSETVRSDSTSQTIQQTRLGTESDVTKLMEKTSFGINETETENVTVVFDYKISTSDHLTTNISSVAPIESDITSSTLSTDAKVSDYYVSEDITTLTEINRTNISSQTSEVTMSHSSPRQPTDHFLFTEDFIGQFNTTTEKGPSKSENITDFSRENTTDKLSYTTKSSASSSSKTNITDEVSRTAEFIDKSNIYNLTESIISNINATYSSDHITTTLMSKIINITTYRPKSIQTDSDFRTTQFAIHDITPNVSLADQYISSAETISIQNATAKISSIVSNRTRATSLSYSIFSERTKLPRREITTASTKMLTTPRSSTISTRPSKINATMKPSIKVCISVRIKIPKTVASANRISNHTKLSKRLCWIVNKLSMFKFPDQSTKKSAATNIATSISWLTKSMIAIIPSKYKYTYFSMRMIVNWVQRRLRLFFNFNWLSLHRFKSTCIVLVIKPATVGKAVAQQPNSISGSVSHKQQGTLKLKVCRPAKQLTTTTSTRLTTTKTASSLTVFKYENKTHVERKITHPGNPAPVFRVVSTAKRYYHYGKNVIGKIYRKNQRILQKTLTKLSNLWRGVNQITNRLYQPATNRRQGIRKLWTNAWVGAQKAYEKSQLLVRKTYMRVVHTFSSVFDQARSTTATKIRQYYNSYRNYYNNYLTHVQNTAQYFKKNYDYYTKNLRNYWNRYVT
eukprot:XP_014785705.1 PREDICTED: mucin-5AC-like [Octopus bimaculoides]